MKNDLKPCPFCGGVAAMWNRGNMNVYKTYRACCMKCHVAQADGIYYSEKDAVTAWNKRVKDGN